VRDVSGEDDLGPDNHIQMSDGVSDSRPEWVRVRREQQDIVEPPSMSVAETQTVLPTDGLATLGGRVVHVASQAGAGPPIVLLGGCGVPSYDWDSVADLLSDAALVRLDRPGLLGSEWPDELPQLAAEVATLEALVALTGRAIIVAHSMAGFHAEALVRERPDLVIGLVLADGSVELNPSRPKSRGGWLWLARFVRKAMGIPALRLLSSFTQRLLVAAQSHRSGTEPVSSVTRQTFRNAETIASVLAEQAAYAEQAWDLAEFRKDYPWPGVPTVVLTAAEKGGARWIVKQAELAEMLKAPQIVVEDSRHLIMIDRPDVVAQAVRALHEGRDDHG
jgi:pimeloyl-ACP methyl ester carboxylesterase